MEDMEENVDQLLRVENNEVSEKQEVGKKWPEMIANSPLEKTTYVMSVPVMGEWRNGNLLRMLRNVLSQRLNPGEAMEVELVANIGRGINDLLIRDGDTLDYKKDDQGNYLLRQQPEDEKQEKALETLRESDESVGYLRKLVTGQRLARELLANPRDDGRLAQVRELVGSVEDWEQREVLELAIKKAGEVSVAVVDATRSLFHETPYMYASIDTFRTLGVDVASARFEGRPDLVIGLDDADTVFENNMAVATLQRLFEEKPDLNYVFLGMSILPAGHSKELIRHAPEENIRRTWVYNYDYIHGSPQILFRLRAYDKLKELSGWTMPGFHGDEDRDASKRLVYHFGRLQDGLLMERSVYLPSVLTADRLDGFCDSASRRGDYENGTRLLKGDVGKVLGMRYRLMKMAEGRADMVPGDIEEVLASAREYFGKRMKVQQRMNRLVLNMFVDGVDKGLIRLVGEELQVDEAVWRGRSGESAFRMYVRNNEELVKSVVASEDDLKVIRYYLGKTTQLPREDLTQFQLAVREYVGDVVMLDDLFNRAALTKEKLGETAWGDSEWKVIDGRQNNAKASLMYSVVTEMLALGHVYKTIFENQDFWGNREASDSLSSWQWPDDPDKQVLEMYYGELGDRLEMIRGSMNVSGREVVSKIKKDGRWEWSKIVELGAIPLSGLWARLRR